jgi:ribosomal protein S3AE
VSNLWFALYYSAPNLIGTKIEKATQGIYPLKDVFVRKVKVLRLPRLDGMLSKELSRRPSVVRSSYIACFGFLCCVARV